MVLVGLKGLKMSDSPMVSLLIPIYNVERYLEECLDSAVNQTLKDIEIICINDGSTDSSPDIIRRYIANDGRVKMIDKANSGYGSSMNMGLDAATGKYIGILESDDYLELDALEVMVAAAEKNDSQIVRSDFFLFWSQPEVRNQRFYWVDECLEGVIDPQTETDVFLRKSSIWSCLYRKDFLEENEIRFLETLGASYQDTGFNFKTWACCTNAVMLNRAFLHYRQDNEASSVNSSGKVFCICDEYEEIVRYINEHFSSQKHLRGILSRMRVDNYEWNYQRLSDDLKKEFLPRMHEDILRDEVEGFVDERYFDPDKMLLRRLIAHDPELYALVVEGRKTGSRKGLVKLLAAKGGIGSVLRYFRYRILY